MKASWRFQIQQHISGWIITSPLTSSAADSRLEVKKVDSAMCWVAKQKKKKRGGRTKIEPSNIT
jgi:hypothetical protein